MSSNRSAQDTDNIFSRLPKDVRNEIITKYSLDKLSIFYLAQASKSFREVIVDRTDATKKSHNEQLKKLSKILSHAALGEWNSANSMWMVDPSILTYKGTIYHPNQALVTPEMNPGRYKYRNHTAWQIALMNEEFDIAIRMSHYIAEEEKQKQFKEIFPNGIIYKSDIAMAKELLNNLFDTIINDKTITYKNLDIMNHATRAALYAVYRYIKPGSEHRTGLVFDVNIYLEAMNIYNNRHEHIKRGSHHGFWNIRVEEHIASLLPTKYLNIHTAGAFYDNAEYFAFRRSETSVPGFSFFIGVNGGLLGADIGAEHQALREQAHKKISKEFTKNVELGCAIDKEIFSSSHNKLGM